MHVILDVSRLLFCVRRVSPSGIDRVEMAYVRRWLAEPPEACTFVAQSLLGRFGTMSRASVAALVDTLGESWERGRADPPRLLLLRRLLARVQAGLLAGLGRLSLRARLESSDRSVFLLVSHRALEWRGPIAALRRRGAAFVPLIHDLIPTTHPEYARPSQVMAHRSRIATTAALADGIIVNSAATAETLLPFLRGRRPALPPICVAPLGVERRPSPCHTLPTEPYFVALGTIEPRKNHLLLLHLWRDLAARLGPRAPRLVLVGRRGWENENILDMLDRCTALGGLVQERGAAPDAQVTELLAGARALLFPSFTEGYGLPVMEALAQGVPVLASDLPSLREVAGTVPDYLDPVDGIGWRDAILDYAGPDSARRAAQLARLAGWQPPAWEDHFAQVDVLLAQLAGAMASRRLPRPLADRAPEPVRPLPAVTADLPLG